MNTSTPLAQHRGLRRVLTSLATALASYPTGSTQTADVTVKAR